MRAWQKAADRDEAEPGGLEVAMGELNKALAEMARRMERLQKSGLKKLSRTDEEARFLRQRGGFVLGYTGEIAVSDDHPPAHRSMRAKSRSPDGEAAYARRKAVVEPVFGVPKQQGGIRQFRTRGLQNVNNQFTLANLAYNITRRKALMAA